jgi:tetraacyldisaccharide 4'-kinase
MWQRLAEQWRQWAEDDAWPEGLGLLAQAAAAMYGVGARLRRLAYGRQWLKVQRLPGAVISIGNLTVGGAGKTPVTAALAQMLQAQGRRVCILSRGYGGQTPAVACISDGQQVLARPPQVGEEPYWLARRLPGVAVYTGASRYAAGMTAWQEVRPDLFLLDDGFQHFQLHRDLDLVLLDAAEPLATGRLLPWGRLREPAAVLSGADVLLLTRFNPQAHGAALAGLVERFPDKPLLTAAIEPVSVKIFPQGSPEPLEALRGRLFLAFAGMARPQVFLETLRQSGADLRGMGAFPDHHGYTPANLAGLVRQARSQGAEALITTGKDFARLGETWEADMPLWVLEVEARFHQPERLLALISDLRS